MLDIKFIRENPDIVKENIRKKFQEEKLPLVDEVIALDAQRRIGLHVTNSLLLNPTKSVTAIIGLSDRPQAARIRGCAYCSMRETCALRKGGKHCGN